MSASLVRSERSAGRRSRRRWGIVLVVATIAGVAMVALWGERGDPARALEPIRSVVVLGVPRSVAAGLLPLAFLAGSMAAALRGARVRSSADETWVILSGPLRGPMVVAALRGIEVAGGIVLVVVASLIAVSVGRAVGGIDGGFPDDRWPAVGDWAVLAARATFGAFGVAVAWMWGWTARLSPGASLTGWVAALVVVPSAAGAVLDHPGAEVGGAFLESLLRGGPVICSLSGSWPTWSDASTHPTTTAIGLAAAVLTAIGAGVADRLLFPSPGGPRP